MFVLFSIIVSVASMKNTFKSNMKSNSKKNKIILTPMAVFQSDKSSVWEAGKTVDLLILLSKDNTQPPAGPTPTLQDYQKVQSDCLGNLRNLGDKWANNMKYFWNICYDFVKDDNDSRVNEKFLKEAFGMVNEQTISSPAMNGQKCEAAFTMKFDAQKTKTVIKEFFKKYNFKAGGKPFISSFASAHRNIAGPDMFKKLNGDA